MKLFITVLSSFLIGFKGFPQTDFYQAQNLSVTKQGINIINPWAGGLNVPQMSPIDLNGDQLLDLVIFDKNGDQINSFINHGTEGIVDYHYAPKYNIKFPEIEDWILLRDYNCDSRMDIFTSFNGGINVYKNTMTNNELSFELIQKVYTDRGSGETDMYVSSVDIPHIGDLDGDGDLDILTFSIIGSHVEWHKNNSIEIFGNCDSLKFILEDDCWGDFSENFSDNSVTLYDCEALRPIHFDKKENNIKHSGSTVTAIDLNGDSYFELLLGDVTFDNLVMLENSAPAASALMVNQNTQFPSSSESVNIPKFPAAYYFDVNNDNIKDLIVCPNGNNVSTNHKNVWYYKNESFSEEVNLNLIQKDAFADQMIDVGAGANPVFFDYNNDGLMDLIVANYGYYIEGGNFNSQLALYKNIGTETAPEFEWITDDYAALGTLNFDNNISPTFGDIDGDNDLDMLVGDANGKLHLLNNILIDNESNFFINSIDYFDIDVGSFASPFLVDLDRDSDLDLIIGSRQGQIYYYENQGTPYEPNFILSNEIFGNINLIDPIFNTAYTTPRVIDTENGYELFVGTEKGSIYHYTNIDDNLMGEFQIVNDSILLYSKGIRTAPAVYDLDNDGFNDMLLGTYTGGIHLLWGGEDPSLLLKNHVQRNIDVFPNPSEGIIHIGHADLISEIEIYSIEGKLFYKGPSQNYIDISHLTEGIYLLHAKKKIGGKLFSKICIY
tara:strand:+ start:561 stop:2726 length:2166 start_codon:yes stop_codon:yes gene_type:complete